MPRPSSRPPPRSQAVRKPPATNPRRSGLLTGLVLSLFVGGGLLCGAVFLVNAPVQGTGSSLAQPVAALRAILGGLPSEDDAGLNLPSYADQGRLTILLLGIDQRPDEAAAHRPSRTDTMIIATVDPRTRRAALISIPRDLVVPIAGHGNDKINTAHFWGETDHPGGGPRLAVDTVERNFGIHVDYYARVDFLAFVRLIDAIGGIVVDVPRPIRDDDYPTEDYGIRRIYIPAGPQWMDGARALEYARSRHSENDFSRQARQRQVILAAERKALEPRLLVKLPGLIGILQQSVGTDVPLGQIPALVSLARSIPPQNIVSTGITYDMIVDVNQDGTELRPDQAKIRRLFDSIFEAPGAGEGSAEATAGPPAKVEVLNGTTRDGLAASTADLLKGKGYAITRVAQAATSDHLVTEIVDRSGARHAGAAIARLLGVASTTVRPAPPRDGAPDVTITLGFDVPEINHR